MIRQNHNAWDEYACEQSAVRRRELYEQADVSGREALDFILDAITAGTAFTKDEARRSRLTSARRERAQASLRTHYAPSVEANLLYRRGPDAECTALVAVAVLKLSSKTGRAFALQAQGYADHEIGTRVGLSAAAVRQRLSRFQRQAAQAKIAEHAEVGERRP